MKKILNVRNQYPKFSGLNEKPKFNIIKQVNIK